jgi:hypothetical protein
MVICRRQLLYTPSEGAVVAVSIRLFAPEGGDPDWHCRYEIDWPNGVEAHAGYGTICASKADRTALIAPGPASAPR